LIAVAAVALAAPAAAQNNAQTGSRARIIAALERLMLTGKPLHNTHNDGVLLQAAVDNAFARNDREIIQLAQRAASPIVVRVLSPVASTRDLPGLELKRIDVLKLPQPVTYTAHVFVSVDGGEIVRFGVNSRTGGQSVVHGSVTFAISGRTKPARRRELVICAASATSRFAERSDRSGCAPDA
jgi:hypothetical protein